MFSAKTDDITATDIKSSAALANAGATYYGREAVVPLTVIDAQAQTVSTLPVDSKTSTKDPLAEVKSKYAIELEELKALHKKLIKPSSEPVKFSPALIESIADNKYQTEVLNLKAQKINSEQAEQLFAALAKNSYIKILNLDDNQIGNKGMSAYIKYKPALIALSVARNNICVVVAIDDPNVIANGVIGIEDCKQLRVLNISNNLLGSIGAKCISANNSIGLLDISACLIEGAGVKAFFEKPKSNLRSLNARCNLVQMHGEDDSVSPMSLSTGLLEVSLGGEVIGKYTLGSMAKAQRGFLRTSFLKNPHDAINHITVRHCAQSPTLTLLDLRDCELRGTIPFAQAHTTRIVPIVIEWHGMISLRVVDISRVKSPSLYRSACFRALVAIPTLEVMMASHFFNQFDSETYKAEKGIITYMAASKSLTHVDLSGNKIGEEDARDSEFNALHANEVLRTLNISGNKFGTVDAKALTTLPKTSALTELDISDNRMIFADIKGFFYCEFGPSILTLFTGQCRNPISFNSFTLANNTKIHTLVFKVEEPRHLQHIQARIVAEEKMITNVLNIQFNHAVSAEMQASLTRITQRNLEIWKRTVLVCAVTRCLAAHAKKSDSEIRNSIFNIVNGIIKLMLLEDFGKSIKAKKIKSDEVLSTKLRIDELQTQFIARESSPHSLDELDMLAEEMPSLRLPTQRMS